MRAMLMPRVGSTKKMSRARAKKKISINLFREGAAIVCCSDAHANKHIHGMVEICISFRGSRAGKRERERCAGARLFPRGWGSDFALTKRERN